MDELSWPDEEKRVERNSRLPMRKSLTKREILRGRSDITRVFRQGERVSCSGSKLVYMRNNLPYSRVLISPVRNFGRAVDRNRIRRLLKEIFRHSKEHIATGYDLIFVVYPKFGDNYSSWQKRMLTLLRRGNLLTPYHEEPRGSYE